MLLPVGDGCAFQPLRFSGGTGKLILFSSLASGEYNRNVVPVWITNFPSPAATILANVASLGQACIDLIFPVSASRKIARRRNGWLGSELSRLDREGFVPSRVTNVATIVLSLKNQSEVSGKPRLSPFRPNTCPKGALPTAARKSLLHVGLTEPGCGVAEASPALIGKSVNSPRTVDKINKSMRPEIPSENGTQYGSETGLPRPCPWTHCIVVNHKRIPRITVVSTSCTLNVEPVVVPSGAVHSFSLM